MTPSIYLHDQLTSVTDLSAHDGQEQQSLQYRAFGDLGAVTGSTPNRLRYTGREQDPETNLYYYRARYYDPSIGRFISEDPIGFDSGDVNFYAYVGNNPINANDPSGQAAKKLLEAIDWVIKRFEPGPFAKEGVPLTGPGPQQSAVRAQINEIGSATGCHLCGIPTPGTASGNWVVDHIPPSALANGQPQLGYPSCINCSNSQGGYVSAAKSAGQITMGGLAAIGAWLADPKDAIAGVGQLVFDFSPLSDIWDAIKIENAGAGSSFWGSGTPYPTYQDYATHTGIGGGASGGFLLYPNRPNTNSLQAVYQK